MNFPHSTVKRLLRTLAILNALLTALPASAQLDTAKPAQPGDAPNAKEQAARKSAGEKAAVGKDAGQVGSTLNKREQKALKREKQREAMLKRIELRGQGVPSGKPTPPPAPPTVPNPYQFTEDFDWNVKWEQKDNRGGKSNTGYG